MSKLTDQWIDAHKGELIEYTRGILRIPSVQGPAIAAEPAKPAPAPGYPPVPPVPASPFGEKVREAEDFMLKVAGVYNGFKTFENEGYYACVDAGEEEGVEKEMVGIVCHLDVVPEGTGWDYPAYGSDIIGDKIYARGAIDDKGPAMAALYALKAVTECGYKFKRQVRLIFGLNEETGMECLKKYITAERIPEMSFSPDANYPVTNSEKSILRAKYKCEYASHIKFTAGEAVNIVPGKAFLTVNGNDIVIDGVQSHASLPEDGVNAAQKALKYLAGIKLDDEDKKKVSALCKYFGEGYYGEAVDLDKADVSGRLTLNLGLVRWDENGFEITLDLRCPTSLPEGEIREKLAKAFAEADAKEVDWDYSQGFSVPDDSELVQKLMQVYQNRSGDYESKPMKIGGGTYARNLPNAVSFGPEGYMCEANCHVANEFITIPQLLMNCKMLAEAIIALACE